MLGHEDPQYDEARSFRPAWVDHEEATGAAERRGMLQACDGAFDPSFSRGAHLAEQTFSSEDNQLLVSLVNKVPRFTIPCAHTVHSGVR